ncbi:hypothetical protein ABT158_22570 [Nonomuraea sp. NPDC001636]|uniref:hypothetical protein n=1 Tax=Nonomuraea sp. NPDC001636 TaxID=3154391 RepID=UPI003328DF5B
MNAEELSFREDFCRSYSGLESLAAQSGRLAEVEAIRKAIVDGELVAERISNLYRFMGIGDPSSTRTSLNTLFAGISGADPAVFVCPEDRCGSRVRPRPGERTPYCAMSQAPLRRLGSAR